MARAHAQLIFKLLLNERSDFEMVSCRVLLSLCLLPGVVFCWWPFSTQKEPEEPSRHVGIPRKAASFEMMSAEQKFLSDAQQFLDLTPLDQCLHRVSLLNELEV